MEKQNFNYQNHRDKLSDELKDESNKDSRKELHDKAKDTAEYKAAELLRDDKRQDRIEQSKETKEEIKVKNAETLKELEGYQAQMNQYLNEFVSSVDEDTKKVSTNKEMYDETVEGMKQSVLSLNELIAFFNENIEQLNESYFRIVITIHELKRYKPARLDPTAGKTFASINLGEYTNYSSDAKTGRLRLVVEGPSHGDDEAHPGYENHSLIDIYFPAEDHIDMLIKEIDEFKENIKKDLTNIGSVPLHKI